MRTVYKYPLPWEDWAQISVTRGAKVLSVGVQGDQLCAWILIDTARPYADMRLRIAGTGHDMDTISKENDFVAHTDFVGTVFYETLVFHLFAWEVL